MVLLQVILIGHSSGGACISYALEHFPQKISKAIFICATMVSNGQRPFDVFAEEVCNQYNYLTYYVLVVKNRTMKNC